MKRAIAFVGLVLIVLAGMSARAGAQPLQTMEVTKLADGVYGAVYSEMVTNPVQSNSLIIIGETGVCVVDSHYTPSAARATIAEIKKLTPLPVRYVVTTHWHDDHVFGNRAYRDAFPGVEFVAQDAARASMVAGSAEHLQQLVKGFGEGGPKIEERLASGKGPDGKLLSEEDRKDYARLLPIYREYAEDFKTAEVVLPTITFDKELTLHLGARDVLVRSFGPGNTKGDAVIYLPKEKIAAVGDLVVYPVPFIYGGFPVSWAEALRSVRALGVETIVPGHGPVMRDFVYVDRVSALPESMASQAKASVAKGLTLEETRKAMDLKSFHDQFVEGKEAREGTWESSIIQSGIKAAYDEARQRAGGLTKIAPWTFETSPNV